MQVGIPRRCAIAAALMGVTVAGGAFAADFYKDKTVELIISTGVGGGLDTNARIVARHLAKHIPGSPTIVAKNMPGAGHVRAANYIYNQAPQDGTVIGTLIPAFVMAQVLKRSDSIQFDAAKFNWLASTSASNSTVYVWKATGVRTIEDVKKRETLMGGTGAGSYTSLYPLILNHVIGTKFKVIAGYNSTAEIRLAMERGEVEGRAGNNINSLLAENADWLKDDKIVLLAQVGLERDPHFTDVPLMTEFARTDEERAILRLFSADVVIGRPFLTAPGVPTERVALLRKAFVDMAKDPAYLKESQAAGLDVALVEGARVQKTVEELVATPGEIVEKAKLAIDTKGLAEKATDGKTK
ncbi:MAG TPA: tripartite tricarboxylate transporter substrate-binding protein [Hyphomicrobiaceae bacterium]|nr:tripartite tricarboxylate transporter substrate-binding protein [Hyphomicrobiaceae bacterium]